MRILITTGIYPPQVGGPAQYAKELRKALQDLGHTVRLARFDSMEYRLPSGLRHVYFLMRILPSIIWSETIITLDTMSAGVPTVFGATLFRRPIIIRTGGDFLWENYVERTRDMVLFRDFYKTRTGSLNLKERIIYILTRNILHLASHIVFSTKWQRDIWTEAYNLNPHRISIIENYFGHKEPIVDKSKTSIFFASTRPLVWKNIELLKESFSEVVNTYPGISLVTDIMPYEKAIEFINKSRAIILVSLGDISPNMVLDALRLGTPAIVTRECGLDCIKEYVKEVDPLSVKDIAQAIRDFNDPEIYEYWLRKARSFNRIHIWQDIAKEFEDLLTRDKIRHTTLISFLRNRKNVIRS